MILVVDASVTIAASFPDEQDAFALAVESALVEFEGHVPWIWPIEVVNAWIVAERQKRMERADVDRSVAALSKYAVQIHQERPPLTSLVDLCRRHQRTAYDALYLSLALDLNAQIAPLDGGLRQSCREAGIALFSP